MTAKADPRIHNLTIAGTMAGIATASAIAVVTVLGGGLMYLACRWLLCCVMFASVAAIVLDILCWGRVCRRAAGMRLSLALLSVSVGVFFVNTYVERNLIGNIGAAAMGMTFCVSLAGEVVFLRGLRGLKKVSIVKEEEHAP